MKYKEGDCPKCGTSETSFNPYLSYVNGEGEWRRCNHCLEVFSTDKAYRKKRDEEELRELQAPEGSARQGRQDKSKS